MKAVVVGAGPAGLYFALKLKQLEPCAEIKIVEKELRASSNGLGYVLQKPIFDLLGDIGSFSEEEFLDKCTVGWDVVDIEAKSVVSTRRFPYSVGIRRGLLVDYLRDLVQRAGVEVVYGCSLNSADITAFKRDADVVVGADGLHSVVRSFYSEEFGASAIESTNSYIWLGKTNREALMRVSVQEHKGVALVGTTYPIGRTLDTMIVEANTQKLRSSGMLSLVQTDEISTKGLKDLEWGFFTLYSGVNLQSINSHWSAVVVNSCERLTFENVALMGEAGISTHYSAGAGLLVAFKAAGSLAEQLTSIRHIPSALGHYNRLMLPFLLSASEMSLQSMRWLERVDSFYADLEGDAFIHAFGLKGREVSLY